MRKKTKYLIAIVGPTAVGKTALSLRLASFFNSEIISADSRQMYKEMKIGTAKPSPLELLQIKHYFIDSHTIQEEFNAGKFEEEGLKILEQIFISSDLAIMVGGSGLYIDAICKGMDHMPSQDRMIRQRLNQALETNGLDELLDQLEKCDPNYFNEVDKKNPQRIIRALEVYQCTGTPYSLFRKKQEKQRPFEIIKIGVELPREILYDRIDKRMDKMILEGLFEEAKQLYAFRHLNALQTVGYTEIFDFFEHKYDCDEAIRLLKRNSRRYAKRQLTWFKRDLTIKWFHPDNEAEIRNYILQSMNKE